MHNNFTHTTPSLLNETANGMNRNSSRRLLLVPWLLFVFFYAVKSFAQPFSHPGLLHTGADFARMQAKVAAAAEPWKSSWDILVANPHSSLSRAFTSPIPAIVYRGFDGTHTENYASLFRDAASAYATALRWKISGDAAYADKSIAILNAWAAGMTTISGTSDKYLLAGIQGYQLANAAEIMRTYNGWATADFAAFQNWMLSVFYAMNHDFLINHNGACISNYWANWDLANMASMLGIGVLCDRRDVYNEAVDYFKTGAGNGAITKLVPYLYGDLGQWQESGRDQGHTVLGVALAGTFAEMAWNQGDDLYGYDNNRLLKGFEYIAKYNLGYDVPYTTYGNCTGIVQTIISADGRGNVRPVWELVYNHYVNRKGLPAPYTGLWAQRVRPEGGGGNYGPNSGGYDQLGYGTLTATLETTAKPNNQTITFPSIPTKNYNDPDFNPGAVASSGLPVVYSVADPTVASVNAAGTLHILKPGTTVVYAQQPGDANYNAAPVAQQTVTVNQIPGTTDGTWSNTTGVTTTAIASTTGSATLTWSGQTFAAGDLVRLTGTVPGGFTANTPYNVIAAGGNTFQLSLTPGGTPVTATTTISNGTGQRYVKWLASSNWSGGTVPGGVQSTATFGAVNFTNIAGVTLDDNITIGNLVYAANGTAELVLASGANGGKLTFATVSGTPAITVINTGTRKLFLGNAINNARVPLKIAGTQGLIINTPVYGGGNPAGLRIQAAMDWSEFSGGITFSQGTIELHNTTNSPTAADNVLLPPQRLKMATENTAVLIFTGAGNVASKQTIGALDGTSDAYIIARPAITNGAATLIVGADNGDGVYDGTIGASTVDLATDRGRINLEKTGTGTQTVSGVIKNGTTTVNGTDVYSAVTVNNGKLILTGANEYRGTTTVNGGVLIINGSVVSPVSVNAGLFGGNGRSTANITVGTGSGTGATLAPGNSVGTFTTAGAVTLQSDATYAVELNSASGSFDKVAANGISINGATLSLANTGSNATLPVGAGYVIVDNRSSSAVSGTFQGLAEGASVTAAGNAFRLSYAGGTGNDVTLTVTGTVLPVSLLRYDAKLLQNRSVLVSWSTAREVNNDYFAVERSTDGQSFSSLGRTASAGNAGRDYSFTDAAPAEGNNYYRLKQVDKNGTTKTFDVKTVHLQGLAKDRAVYPNPVKAGQSLFVKVGSENSDNLSVQLYDAAGKRILNKSFGKVTAGAIVELKLDKPLATGIYTVQLNNRPLLTIVVER